MTRSATHQTPEEHDRPVSAARGRAATARRITRAAQELAITRGFDGFTMDDLAEAAEVSRRTLFNYHATKEGAVLGPVPQIPADVFAEFAAGGPSGNLVQDLAHVVDVVTAPQLDHDGWSAEALSRVGHLLERNPHLLVRVKERFTEVGEQVAPALAERLGCAPDDPRVGTLYLTAAMLMHVALEDFICHPGDRPVAELFADRMGLLRDTLAA